MKGHLRLYVRYFFIKIMKISWAQNPIEVEGSCRGTGNLGLNPWKWFFKEFLNNPKYQQNKYFNVLML